MKSTGVVRRIDELGRLVIPKEIRKSFKIREGDSIEFFVEGNRILLEKYSLMRGLIDDIANICLTLQEAIENTVLYVYEDYVISGAGKKFDECKEQAIGRIIKSLIHERVGQSFKDIAIVMNSNQTYSGYVCPLIVQSDLFGTFIIIADQRPIQQQDINLVSVVSKIVTRQQEV